MSTTEPAEPLDAALSIAEVFERTKIPYAIGGALALGLWGIPRATADVDMNIFVTNEQLPAALAALGTLGISSDEQEVLRRVEKDGMFVVRHGAFRIDVFTPSIEFSWEAERTSVKQQIGGRCARFLSAEALAVFKLLFFRAKDLVDLERLVAVQGQRLNVGYVRRHLVEMMGEDDPRVIEWDRLVELHSGS